MSDVAAESKLTISYHEFQGQSVLRMGATVETRYIGAMYSVLWGEHNAQESMGEDQASSDLPPGETKCV